MTAFITRYRTSCGNCGQGVLPGDTACYDDCRIVHVTCPEPGPAAGGAVMTSIWVWAADFRVMCELCSQPVERGTFVRMDGRHCSHLGGCPPRQPRKSAWDEAILPSASTGAS